MNTKCINVDDLILTPFEIREMLQLLVFALLAGNIKAGEECKEFPNIDLNAQWGPDDKVDDTSIREFKVEFKEDMVIDLLYRLKNRRKMTPALPDMKFQYGVNPNEAERFLNYWQNEYNFTEREEYLNKYPHFVTDIQGLTIHFIHIVPEVPKGKVKIPLLLMHGWPGSVREFYGALEFLTQDNDNRDFVFELVVPSLPGCVFSQATNKVGLGAVEIAIVMRNLMCRLGFNSYYVQGGDWGSLIGANMATLFCKEILGYHTSMAVALTIQAFVLLTLGELYPEAIMKPEWVDRFYPLSYLAAGYIQESGYLHLQAAKPDSLAPALSDSPSGLFTWIIQQFSNASNNTFINLPDGGLSTYTKDELLDNVMLYWITNSQPTAIRIYAETFNWKNWEDGIFTIPTPVPTYAVQAISEIFYMPPVALNTKFTKLVGYSVLDYGGHFLALEQPEAFAEEVFKGIQVIREFRNKNNITCVCSIACERCKQ